MKKRNNSPKHESRVRLGLEQVKEKQNLDKDYIHE